MSSQFVMTRYDDLIVGLRVHNMLLCLVHVAPQVNLIFCYIIYYCQFPFYY